MIVYDYKIDVNDENAAAKLLRQVGRNKKVLEVGCSTGYMTKIMQQELGCEVTAIELNEAAAEIAKNYCKEIFIGDIEKFDLSALKDKYFDVIMFADVLEHLYSPTECLIKIERCLKDDGYLLASIPNITHLSVINEMCNNRFNYKDTGLLDKTHIRFFTKENINKMFNNSGFLITSMDRVIVIPQNTEFGTNFNEIPSEVKEFITKNNSEFQTYQFICRAYKQGVHAEFNRFSSLEGELKRLESIEVENKELIEKCNELTQQIIIKDKLIHDMQGTKNWRAAQMIKKILGR
jgi:2-polyprenyl-3-methyl-5-hydroxy-6-metoxy-1,4-benzoquinol methylase